MKIIGICGSLRKESYNSALLDAAKELAPAGTEIERVDISSLPLYNQDIESPLPAAVSDFKNKIKSADAVMFVTPEYDYSIPGVLKNAIDWGSRPHADNSFEGKPAAIMSASIGMLGGARAQYHLRQIMVYLNMYPVNRPEVMVPFEKDKFDENMKLTDETTRQRVKELLEELVAWTAQLKGER